MKIYTTEIFGPVMVIVGVRTLKDAIDLVNANPFGNGTAILLRAAPPLAIQSEIDVGKSASIYPFPCPCRSSASQDPGLETGRSGPTASKSFNSIRRLKP